MKDPFEGTFELEVGLVGPELWRDEIEAGPVAARFHKGHARVMVLAEGTINGKTFQFADLYEKGKGWDGLDERRRQILKNAFRRAKERAGQVA